LRVKGQLEIVFEIMKSGIATESDISESPVWIDDITERYFELAIKDGRKVVGRAIVNIMNWETYRVMIYQVRQTAGKQASDLLIRHCGGTVALGFDEKASEFVDLGKVLHSPGKWTLRLASNDTKGPRRPTSVDLYGEEPEPEPKLSDIPFKKRKWVGC
jgi:hypothetical protein